MTALAARVAEPDLAGLPEWQVADLLNTPDPALPTKRVDTSTSDVRGALLASGEWPGIIMAAEPGSGALQQVRGLCVLVRDTLTLTHTIQTSVPARYAATVAALDGLLAAGLIVQTTHDALIALADAPQSWAELHGVVVTAGAVGVARGAIG